MEKNTNCLLPLSILLPLLLLMVGKYMGKNEMLLTAAVLLICIAVFSTIDLLMKMKECSMEGGDPHGKTMAAITFLISVAALIGFRFYCGMGIPDMINGIKSENAVEVQSVEAEPAFEENIIQNVSDETKSGEDFTVVKKITSISDSDNAEYQIYAEKDGKITIITVDKDEYDRYSLGDTYLNN